MVCAQSKAKWLMGCFIFKCSELTSVRPNLLIASDSDAEPVMNWEDREEQRGFSVTLNNIPDGLLHHCVSTITLRVLCGNKGLDESVGALGVERQGVTQRSQFRTFLNKGLLQAVSSCMEILLEDKEQQGEGEK